MDILVFIKDFIAGLNLTPWALFQYLLKGGISLICVYVFWKVALKLWIQYDPISYLQKFVKWFWDCVEKAAVFLDDGYIDKVKEKNEDMGNQIEDDFIKYVITYSKKRLKKIEDIIKDR